MSRNHLEGRTAAFFCYGDGGGDELNEDGRPKILRQQTPPAGSSPAQHQDLGLNRDATLSPKKSERKRLREGRHE